MDGEVSVLKDVETPSSDGKDDDSADNYVSQASDQEVIKSEMEIKNEDLSESNYLPTKEVEGSGNDVLGGDIMERIYCITCNKYNCVTEFSFRHKLQSFCDTCYQNYLTKYKSEWMDLMYEWYESCMICMNVFYNNLDMIRHDCSCKELYCCNDCNLIIVKKGDIERHVQTCGSQSSSLHNVATKKSLEGRIVTGESNSRYRLPKDKSNFLGYKGKFFDSFSKNTFSTSSYIEKKKNKSTHAFKQYKCNYCDKNFRLPSYLRIHLRIHTNEKKLSCIICKKSFFNSSSVKRHLRIHSGEKPFSCKICKKSFSDSSSVKRHLRIHSGEKPFSCKICKKSFSDSTSVKRHLRIHSGEKPFSCKVCKKSFSDSTSVKRHLNVHSGEKPFSCKICKKSFSDSSSVKRHLRLHSSGKPFSCKICKKSFSHSNHLKKHLRIHSGKK